MCALASPLYPVTRRSILLTPAPMYTTLKFYWLFNKGHNSSALSFIFQLLHIDVCTILNTIEIQALRQFTVLFCTVLGGRFLVRWGRPWSDHVETALPLEYETKKTQKKWKGRRFRPAGISRFRRSGEKSCRFSARRINLLSRRGRGQRHVRPEGRREILSGEWVRKRSGGRHVWPE